MVASQLRENKFDNAKVFTIDYFQGDGGVNSVAMLDGREVFTQFRAAMMATGLWLTYAFPLIMFSSVASTLFVDGSVSLCFIDAGHDYASAHEDITLWLPKVKKGGVLCGHDLEIRYSALSDDKKEFYNNTKVYDAVYLEDSELHFHPGVALALYDIFGDDFEQFEDTRIWWREIK